jgi:predicted tellurium resistance membrane protein TerC
MFEWIASPEAWVALATLTALEIVLGIDNIIFISILSGRLPKEQRPKARTLGLAGAMFMRVALLLSLAWVAKLTVQLFTLFGDPFTARDVVLVGGGLFLLGKATFEIHHNLEGEDSRLATWSWWAAVSSCSARRPSRSTTTSRARRRSTAVGRPHPSPA